MPEPDAGRPDAPCGAGSPAEPTGPGQLLLALQAVDLESDRLRRDRATLPERQAVAAIEAAAGELEQRSRELHAGRQQLAAHESALAADAGELATRIALIEERSRGGQVDYRDQEALAGELASLVHRRDELEDEELEELAELDRMQAEGERLEAERPLLVERHRRALAALAASERELDGRLRELSAKRLPIAARLEPRLAHDYERLRSRLGGEVVARVVRGSCPGCHLALPATEADRLRHAAPGTVARCEQCGRLLVS